ncbi:MAG: ROK family protein [Gammaproteobacteria bacterium]|nr:ROK family protein [Gammaproteobacteria bacterium]
MRIGIDLGGTKIEGAVLSDGDRFVERRRVLTPRDYPDICAAITGLVIGMESDLGTRCSVGLSMPGAISPATGRVKNANTVCLNDKPFIGDLEERLDREVRAENDANCLVVSEVYDGAATGDAVVFGVIVGTGTGGGIYANGALIRGANAIGGEWGHNPAPWMGIESGGRACYCGRQDCIETYLSGPGLARSYRERGGGPSATVEAIVDLAARGDATARAALTDYARQFAHAVATVINVLDPDTIVIGGGLSNIPSLSENVERLLPDYVFSDAVTTRVRRAIHGDSSGVRGAARLWEATGG